METWQGFLEKVRTYKKEFETGQINLNAGSLTSLIYAGAFDSLVGTKPNLDDYKRMTNELKASLGSKAEPQKAKKGDMFGIADIDSELVLDLWRNEVNPLHKFDFLKTLSSFLVSNGFNKKRESALAPYYSERHNAFLITSWNDVFENPQARNKVIGKYSDYLAAFVGLISESYMKPLKDGRESMIFKLHLNEEISGPIRIWANEHGFVTHKYTSAIKKGKVGIAITRLDDSWNGYRQGSLVDWIPVTLGK